MGVAANIFAREGASERHAKMMVKTRYNPAAVHAFLKLMGIIKDYGIAA